VKKGRSLLVAICSEGKKKKGGEERGGKCSRIAMILYPLAGREEEKERGEKKRERAEHQFFRGGKKGELQP